VPTYTINSIPIVRHPLVPEGQVLVVNPHPGLGTQATVIVGIGKAKREGRLKRLWRWIARCLRACEI